MDRNRSPTTVQQGGFNLLSGQPFRGNVAMASPPAVSALSGSTGLLDPYYPREQPPLFVRFECEHLPWLPSTDDEAEGTAGLLGTATDGRGTNTMPRRQPSVKPHLVDSSHSLSSALKAYPATLSSSMGAGVGDGDQKKTILRVVATTVPTAISSRGTDAAEEVCCSYFHLFNQHLCLGGHG